MAASAAATTTMKTTMSWPLRSWLAREKVTRGRFTAFSRSSMHMSMAMRLRRIITPAMFMSRTATEDTVVGGQEVCKNDLLNLYFIAANRDEAVFDRPDEFDPWRTETASLTFGSGTHRCIGNALAKLELRILFEEMSKRGFSLKLDGEPQRGWSVFINQIRSLPVAWA